MTTPSFIVCGSRSWENYAVMKFRLLNLDKRMVLIHGDAKGADRMAADIWTRIIKGRNIPFPADWEQYKRRAGPIRNTLMLTENIHTLVLVLAFSNNLSTSKGTQDMVKKALKFKLPIEVIREDTYFHIDPLGNGTNVA